MERIPFGAGAKESQEPLKAGRLALLRSGRYWARTSDPQLVEHGRTFAVSRRKSPNHVAEALRRLSHDPAFATVRHPSFPTRFQRRLHPCLARSTCPCSHRTRDATRSLLKRWGVTAMRASKHPGVDSRPSRRESHTMRESVAQRVPLRFGGLPPTSDQRACDR